MTMDLEEKVPLDLEKKKPDEKSDESECTSETTDSTDSLPERESWGRNIEFLLSLIGYSVAFGNIQRFPYLCAKNGGGAFIIPYFFFLFICGIPLYYLEVCLGQFSGVSPLFAWRISPLFGGIGILMLVVSGICCWYYNTLIAWSLFYLGNSFQGTLPWTTCGNSWNSENCRASLPTTVPVNSSFFNATSANETVISYNKTIAYSASKNVSASLEYWQGNVLRMSAGLHDLGYLQWHMVVSLLAAWILVFLCMVKGVKSLGKVVYVTALLPYILYFAFLVRGLMLPGSLDGILFYLTPNFTRLLSSSVWVEAAIQVFFSLGPAWGGVITMSSYSKFHNNSLKTTLLVTITEGISSFAFGLAVFATLGFMAYDLRLPVADVANNDPGLIFITYPECIGKLPLPQLWAILFWFMMITVGLDTEFGMFETLSSGIIEAFPRTLGKRKTLVVAIICGLFFVVGLPLTTEGGIYVYQLVDWYSAAFCMVLCAFLECVVIGWVYGADRFSRDIELMTGRGVPIIIRICWCTISPIALLTVFIVVLSDYARPTYNGYDYPDYSICIGVLIGLMPVLPVPAVMIWQIVRAKGSLIERVCSSMKPRSSWLPKERKYHEFYMSQEDLRYNSISERVKANLLGSTRPILQVNRDSFFDV